MLPYCKRNFHGTFRAKRKRKKERGKERKIKRERKKEFFKWRNCIAVCSPMPTRGTAYKVGTIWMARESLNTTGNYLDTNLLKMLYVLQRSFIRIRWYLKPPAFQKYSMEWHWFFFFFCSDSLLGVTCLLPLLILHWNKIVMKLFLANKVTDICRKSL